jgi:hypothetical protein
VKEELVRIALVLREISGATVPIRETAQILVGLSMDMAHAEQRGDREARRLLQQEWDLIRARSRALEAEVATG